MVFASLWIFEVKATAKAVKVTLTPTPISLRTTIYFESTAIITCKNMFHVQ